MGSITVPPASLAEYSTGPQTPAAFRLEEDLPGEQLVLAWQGPEPRQNLRRAGSLAVALAGLGVVELVRRLVVPAVQEAIARPGGDIIPVALLAVFLLVCGVVAAVQMLPAFGRAAGYWSGLAWDRGSGTFTASFYTWGLGGNRSVQVPLDAIKQLSFAIGAPGEGPLPIEMTLGYRDEAGKLQSLTMPLTVENLSRRAEAMDLLFRMARILGFAAYAINRCNHRLLDVQVLPSTSTPRVAGVPRSVDPDDEDEDEDEDDEEADEYLSIPDDRSLARYGSETSVKLKQPPLPAPPLNLEKLKAEVESTQVSQWEPPSKVTFFRPAAPPGVMVVLAIIGAIAGGAIGALPLSPLLIWLAQPWELGQWGAGLVGACIGAPFAVALLWRRMQEREVTFDWQAGSVKWHQGDVRGQESLSSIVALELGGVRADRTPGLPRPGVRHEYRSQLKVVFKDRDELVIETDRWDSSADAPYLQLLPVTIELSRALEVSWRYVDRRAASSNPYLPRMTYTRATAAAALIAALAIWIVVRGQADDEKKERLAHIRAAGVECSFLNGSSFRDLHKIENFYKVTPQPGPQLGQTLADLRADLAGIGRFGVELTSSGVSDAGVATLAEQPNLLQLDLAVTPIGDDALAMLGTSNNVEYLNISSTRIGDAGLAHVANLPRLAILLAAYTQVTDNGLAALAKCKQLRYINLAGTAVTDQGLARLRTLLPRAVIEK